MTQQNTAEDASWSEVAQGLIGTRGFYRENEKHSFTYIERSDVLCVTFDNLDIAMNKRTDRRPWGFGFIEKQGWSMLGAMANGWTWYRDPWVIDQFDALKQSGFFRQFRQVIFYGASMGGYAALVFSAACPGATVIAFSPQSTLDKTLVPWETRYVSAWGYDYSGPYGDAATTLHSARSISLFYDPYSELDKGHIDRLHGQNLRHYRCPFLGHRLGSLLQRMNVLQPMVLGAANHDLNQDQFHKLLQSRKSCRRYTVELVGRLIETSHPILAAQACRHVLKSGPDRFFSKTLKELGLAT